MPFLLGALAPREEYQCPSRARERTQLTLATTGQCPVAGGAISTCSQRSIPRPALGLGVLQSALMHMTYRGGSPGEIPAKKKKKKSNQNIWKMPFPRSIEPVLMQQ